MNKFKVGEIVDVKPGWDSSMWGGKTKVVECDETSVTGLSNTGIPGIFYLDTGEIRKIKVIDWKKRII